MIIKLHICRQEMAVLLFVVRMLRLFREWSSRFWKMSSTEKSSCELFLRISWEIGSSGRPLILNGRGRYDIAVIGVLGRVACNVQLNQLALYIQCPFSFLHLSRFGWGFIVMFLNLIQVAHVVITVVRSKIVLIEPDWLEYRFLRVGV